MDLTLDAEQEQLQDAVAAIMRHHPVVDRARQLGEKMDLELLGAFDANGYLDVVRDASAVEGVLVVEQAAKGGALAPIAARVLAGPLAGITDLPPAIGLVDRAGAIVRYASECEAFLVLDGDRARLASSDDADVEPVDTILGAQYGRVTVRGGDDLGDGSGDRLRRAWQVAIAVEVGQTALAAVAMTVEHVTGRYQFGKPIGAFQAVQHRLARSYGMATGALWLARRASWFNTDEYLTASAAAFACEAADSTYTNCHQVSGAIGITAEYGLTLRTLRLYALQRELGGKRAHGRRVAAARRARGATDLPMPVHPAI
ncbi:MAG: acyl-CoA dehydrogenase family protein [Ilumatobacteraceae bacterium]